MVCSFVRRSRRVTTRTRSIRSIFPRIAVCLVRMATARNRCTNIYKCTETNTKLRYDRSCNAVLVSPPSTFQTPFHSQRNVERSERVAQSRQTVVQQTLKKSFRDIINRQLRPVNERWRCAACVPAGIKPRASLRADSINQSRVGPAAADYSCDALSRVHAITRCEIDR